MFWGWKKRNFFVALNYDVKQLEKLTQHYSIFNINEEKEKSYNAEMFLGYEVSNFELIARRLSQGDNQEYERLLNEVPMSEVIRLFAIDAAMNYAENKNAEHE